MRRALVPLCAAAVACDVVACDGCEQGAVMLACTFWSEAGCVSLAVVCGGCHAGDSLLTPGRGGGGAGAHATRINHEAHATRNQQGTRHAHARPTEWGSVCGGRPEQRVEEQGTWLSRTRKCSEAGGGRPEDRGVWTATTVKRPPQQPAQPPIRQLLGAADAQTAHPATSSAAPAYQLLGSANAKTAPQGAPAAAAD